MPENPIDMLFGSSGGGGGGSAYTPQRMGEWEQFLSDKFMGAGNKYKLPEMPSFSWDMSGAPEIGTGYQRVFGGQGGTAAAPPGSYKPQTYTPVQHNAYQFSTQKETPMAESAWKGMETTGVTGIQKGLQSGLQQAAGSMGRRGIRGGSGVASMNMAKPIIGAATEQGALRSNIAMERERALSEARQRDLEREMEIQKAQAAENQFLSTFGSGERQFGSTFGQSERQFASDFDQKRYEFDRQMDMEEQQMGRKMTLEERQQRMNELLGQWQTGKEGTMLASDLYYKPLEMLSQLFLGGLGSKKDTTEGSPGILGGVGGVLGGLFCLPKGTLIQTEHGYIKVDDIQIGNKVKGGNVIGLKVMLRTPGHKFSLHKFEDGKEIIMTKGHPTYEKPISITPVEHDSPYTYDILTDTGYYYINDIQVGSTI